MIRQFKCPYLLLSQTTFFDFQVAETGDAGTNITTKSLPTVWERARMGKMDTARQHRITRKIAAYLVKDMRPYSTVESDYFRYNAVIINKKIHK